MFMSMTFHSSQSASIPVPLTKTKNLDHHRRKPDVYTSQSRILDIQRAEREVLINRTAELCTAERRRTNAVIERLGLNIQQKPFYPPEAAVSPRGRPTSSRPHHVEPVRRHQRGLTRKEEEEMYMGRDCYSPSTSISLVDSHTPTELTSIRFIQTPSPTPPFTPSPPPLPPAAPLPRRRVSRLPVMLLDHNAGVKVLAGGHKLQTAKAKVEEIQKTVENLQQKSTVDVRQHPVAPRRRPAPAPVRAPAPAPAPVRAPAPAPGPVRAPAPVRVPSPTPAPPMTPAPPKKKGTRRGTSLRPLKTVSRGQTAEDKIEELQPLSKPAEGLTLCLMDLTSDNWEKKREALQNLRALAQHHQDTLMTKLHEVCLALIEEVNNLRSCVSCAAMDTLVYLYVYLQKDMDNQAERTGRVLLLKIAQANANVFIQQQANLALEAMVKNCSPGRVLTTLLNTGLNHLSAAVRASTAQQLRLLADTMGAAAVLSAGKTFSTRFVTAVCKTSLDAAAEVRPHGHAILHQLAIHPDFMEMWNHTISEKDRPTLARILRTAQRM
ncbi:TOG array regulator of axonemal microtubules protein 2 isoform X3 [Larimichthys crocea]|uniref:TOG array regulator of axonemal microtubules protein 2 isoform X3 n=1 Tax=Larimichthys crocea TaxID=215358 RepID=UPI000F5E0123|nr:TOG array regulator of axonemal microtubules protein 2 isoform X3 [Larimichthys crocea]